MSEHPFTGRTFFVADDERFSRVVISTILERFGAKVIQAANGIEAIELLSAGEQPLDAAILDYEMPEKNGLHVLKAIRSGGTKVPYGLPVLMLTANTQTRILIPAMALDVDSFMAKPVTSQTLAERLDHLLAQERNLRPVKDYQSVPLPDDTVPVKIGGFLPHRELSLQEIPEGAVLASDLLTGKGDRILAAGQILNSRLLDGLRSLQGTGDPVGMVCISA
jgi:CheY-like chemotaxis protein